MGNRIRGNLRMIVAVTIAALVVGATTGAVAGNLITGADIKNGSVKNKDLSKKVRAQLKKTGQAGQDGQAPINGTDGQDGEDGLDAITKVTALTEDTTGDGVAPPAWGERVSTGCGSGTGDADVAGNTLRFDLPDAGGLDAVGANFNGYNGMALEDLSKIVYHAKYEQAGADQHGGTPYFRIYTEDFANAVIFSPNTQPGANINEGEWQRFSVVDGTVRYDDDAGNSPDVTWAQLIADHGEDEIAQIRIQGGCSGAYSAATVGEADDLTIVAQGQKSTFDFGS